MITFLRNSVMIFSFLFSGFAFAQDIKYIEPKLLTQDDIILDIRTPQEHEEISLTRPHYFVELADLNPTEFVSQNKIPAEKNINILCRSGGRAKRAAQMFIKAGYNNVTVITGGILKAKEQGLETTSMFLE